MSQKINIPFGPIATGAVVKTLAQVVAPADQRIDILGFHVSFDGVTSNEARGTWRLLRQTTAGSGSTALTVSKADDSIADAIRTTAIQGPTTEPTSGAVLDNGYVDPMYGIQRAYEKGRIVIGAADRLGIEVTFGITHNARGAIYAEE